MAKWTGYFKVVTPQPNLNKMIDSQEMTDVGAYNNYTWYSRLIKGSASRLTRYREYDLMDSDVEVARALDTIAEEMTGNNPKTDEPLEVDILTENENNVSSASVLTVKAALRRWVAIHDFETRLFHISRTLIKYGDVFFRKQDAHTKWVFIHPKNVVAAIVDSNDVTKVIAWQIKKDIKKARSVGTLSLGANDGTYDTEIVDAREIVWFSLNHDMSDTAPFGESVLRPVYRAHKQKELLEDAVIIYRVQRAPERRVFYIDVGKMPPQRVKQYLETIKNEIKQKKVPTVNGGQSEIDSVYNPQSMCLALDTEIPLLDGRTLTLKELIKEHEEGKENWVYSIDPKTGQVVPGIISWAGITRKNAETIKLVFDNGDELVCTPDHKIPVQGKGFVEAKDLTSEDNLFATRSIDDNITLRHIVSIEQDQIQDTGTLTIDADEKYHDYHTFATKSIFVRNSEDFFFSVRPDGRGSRVETLPGGQGLGELSDLEYFQRKVWRGLKVPASYMIEQQEGGQIWNDGKVGVAYIQELRFALYIARLQSVVERVLDIEFKKYLKKNNIHIDESMYRIRLPDPSNFGKYRQQEIDSNLLSQYGAADGIQYLSKRFALKRYLQLTDEEIIINERLKREELGLDPDGGPEDYAKIYGEQEGTLSTSFGGGFGGMEGSMGEQLPSEQSPEQQEQPTETPPTETP